MKRKISLSKISSLLLVTVILFSSCDKKEDLGAYENGVFIANEGSWGNENGSISFYSYDANATTNNVFNLVNSRKLGDIVQSVMTYSDKALIAVSSSNKVEIVDKNTFESLQTIEDISGPRYFAANGNKAYVSCWGDNSIKVIDLNTLSVSKSIPVSGGPEKMTVLNNKLYVCNSGGWMSDSLISVINLETEEVVKEITVEYSPRDITVDKDGNLWVLSYGKVVYAEDYSIAEETPSYISKIDAATENVTLKIKLFDTQHPTTIDIDNDGTTMYFGGGYGFNDIYKMTVSGESATSTKIVSVQNSYGFAYDVASDVIFATATPNGFSDGGELYRYSKEGVKLGTYSVGIGPNGGSFKKAE